MADSAPRQKAPAPDFGGANAYRRNLEAGGRVHVDRPLPFLALNRHRATGFSLARRVAMICPASVVWVDEADADAEALASIRAVVAHLHGDYPKFLLVSLYDLPRDPGLDEDDPKLEDFRFDIGVSGDAPAQAAARCLQEALDEVCIDLREPEFDHAAQPRVEPGVGTLAKEFEGLSQLSLGLPQIYRVPGAKRIYPQLRHDLESAVFDALLQCFSAFVAATTPGERRHYRSLGRSRFVDAALQVDEELGRISRSFDFLLSVSPINTVQAWDRFQADGCGKTPEFRYRPLTVSPELAKRRLYAIDLRAVEDPVLERLFGEKRRELDQQLLMLQCRNTPSFCYASLLQYGPVETALLELARAILDALPPVEACGPGNAIDCHEVRTAAEDVVARYRRQVPGFDCEVVLREDIAPGLMVSGQTLMVSTHTRMTRARLDALLQHEISVHVLTAVNGNRQGLGIFGTGLAGYEGIQEGLGVFAELLVEGLTHARLRLLAARVVAVDCLLGGGGFVDCWRLLHHEHRLSTQGAFNVAARVYRSGGLTKDAIYLRGLRQVFDFVASGQALDAFWFGKIAEQHVPVIDELRERGMLRQPEALPEFLSRESARRTLRRIRGGDAFIDLVSSK